MIPPYDQKPDLSQAPLLQNGGLTREFTRIVLLVFVLVSGWQLAHQLVEILLMFAMVFLLAIILNSVVVALEKRGVRRGLAVGLIMLALIGSIILGGFLIVPSALKQANQLAAKAPTYWKTIQGRIGELEKKYPSLKQVLPTLTEEKAGGNNKNIVSSRESSVRKSTKPAENSNRDTSSEESSTDSSTNSAEGDANSENNASNSENSAPSTENDTRKSASDESPSGEVPSGEVPSGEVPSGEATVPPDISNDKEDASSEEKQDKPSADKSSTKSSEASEKSDKSQKNEAHDSKIITRSVTTKTASASPKTTKEPSAPLAGLLQQDALLGYAKSAVAITASLAGAIFVTLLSFLLLMFTLANPQALVGGLLSVAPANQREATRRSLARVFKQMTGWARATLINGTITGVLTGVGLAMVGVQPALVFGICAFFGEFVPNVGPLVAAAPAIFVALSMGPSKAAAALGVIIFVQAVASNALNPIIMGREMKLHPVTITFYALAMGKLFGVTGAILAVPAAATTKILVEEFYLRPCRVNETMIEEQALGIVMNEAGVEEEENKDENKREKPEKPATEDATELES